MRNNSVPNPRSESNPPTEPIFNPWVLSRELSNLELLAIVHEALMGYAFLDMIKDAVDDLGGDDWGTCRVQTHLLDEVLAITEERLAADSGEAG